MRTKGSYATYVSFDEFEAEDADMAGDAIAVDRRHARGRVRRAAA